MGKQRFGCVYRLTNLVTKKTYIGKSVNFKRRMRQHKHSMKKGKAYLSRSIRKHGWDKFKKEIIIDDVPEEDLSNLEILCKTYCHLHHYSEKLFLRRLHN